MENFESKKRNRLWRIPLAAAGLTTLLYAWVHGLKNMPRNNVILSCFSGSDGSILDLPNQIMLSFYVSDFWNILLIAIVVFFTTWFVQESGRSEIVRKALGRLYDLGFILILAILTIHFLMGDITGLNYWGPVYGGYFIFLFALVFSSIAFYQRKKMGISLSLVVMLFIALLIMTPLSLISGVPTGLFAAGVSILGSLIACIIYSLIIWISGEKIFTSLDWLRSRERITEIESSRPLEQRLRYYLAEKNKYRQVIEARVYYFSLTWGLKDCINKTNKLYTLNDAIKFIGEFQRKKISQNKLAIDGRVCESLIIYSYQDENPFSQQEPQVIFSGFKDPIINSDISELNIEEYLCSLGAFVAEKLGQERVLITYGDKVKVIKLE